MLPCLPHILLNFSRRTRRKAFGLHFEFLSILPFVSLSLEDVLSLILMFKEEHFVVKHFLDCRPGEGGRAVIPGSSASLGRSQLRHGAAGPRSGRGCRARNKK